MGDAAQAKSHIPWTGGVADGVVVRMAAAPPQGAAMSISGPGPERGPDGERPPEHTYLNEDEDGIAQEVDPGELRDRMLGRLHRVLDPDGDG
jgi:hypothetical protein